MKNRIIGFYNYTVILTYFGLLTACTGLFYVMSGDYWMAVLCLMIAGICDMFDGTIAATRKRNTAEKHFGIQIDSLSDLVSFGILPAILVYEISGRQTAAGCVSALYILAALIRLAYYNVLEEQRQRETPEQKCKFLGIPVTAICVLLPVVYLFYHFHIWGSSICFSLLLFVTGIGFLIPLEIKKPEMTGKIALLFVGSLEIAGMFLLMGWDTV